MIKRIAAALGVCTVALAAPAIATGAETSPALEVKPQAKLSSTGAAEVRVRVRCPVGLEVLEANVSVSQEQSGASGLAGLAAPCTGHWRWVDATVNSFGNPFEPGPAFASAFLLLIDPATGETTQAQAIATVTLR